MKPETVAPTHSIIFLPGCEQKILFLMYMRLATAKRPFSLKVKDKTIQN